MNIHNKRFAKNLYKEIITLYQEDEEDSALKLLFITLLDNAKLGNFNKCNEFMKLVDNKEFNIDITLHILNVLSSFKNNLLYWNKYVESSKNKLIETKGKEETYILLQVII